MGQGDALHDASHALVVGWVAVAGGLVDRGQGGAVKPDGATVQRDSSARCAK